MAVSFYDRYIICLHCFISNLSIVYIYQVITNTITKHEILMACHDDKVGGCHFGRDKTVEKVTSQYYWKKIYGDVEEWVW